MLVKEVFRGLIFILLGSIFLVSCQICEECDAVTTRTVSDPSILGYPSVDSSKVEVCGRKRDEYKPIGYDSTFNLYGINGPYTMQVSRTVTCQKKKWR